MKTNNYSSTNSVYRCGLFMALVVSMLLLPVKDSIADFTFNNTKIEGILCVPGENSFPHWKTVLLPAVGDIAARHISKMVKPHIN